MTITNVKLIDEDDLLKAGVKLREDGPDVQTPSVEHRYYIIDNDAKTCRVADEAEFKASYVDNNIATFRLQDFSPFEESIDNENLIVNYQNGNVATIRFGLIDTSAGGSPVDQYALTGGVIYPIDDGGDLQLNATNTPVLAATRQWVLNRWKESSADNLKMAELVDAFVKAGFAPVSALGG